MTAQSSKSEHLYIDRSRCLKVRFSESSCTRCLDICPQGAIDLSEGVNINSDSCTACLLCTAVCPSGAVESGIDFLSIFESLSRSVNPVLCCSRSRSAENPQIPCLGVLSIEHLLSLLLIPAETITLAAGSCGSCPNRDITRILHSRIEKVKALTTEEEVNRLTVVNETGTGTAHGDNVSRRNFFGLIRQNIFQAAREVISPTSFIVAKTSRYADKRIPDRQRLLLESRTSGKDQLQEAVRKMLEVDISFSESCSRCQGCAAICPTGALEANNNNDTPPSFDSSKCTACRLCQEFCIDNALSIRTGKSIQIRDELSGLPQ